MQLTWEKTGTVFLAGLGRKRLNQMDVNGFIRGNMAFLQQTRKATVI
jgi:hypothetical protein